MQNSCLFPNEFGRKKGEYNQTHSPIVKTANNPDKRGDTPDNDIYRPLCEYVTRFSMLHRLFRDRGIALAPLSGAQRQDHIDTVVQEDANDDHQKDQDDCADFDKFSQGSDDDVSLPDKGMMPCSVGVDSCEENTPKDKHINVSNSNNDNASSFSVAARLRKAELHVFGTPCIHARNLSLLNAVRDLPRHRTATARRAIAAHYTEAKAEELFLTDAGMTIGTFCLARAWRDMEKRNEKRRWLANLNTGICNDNETNAEIVANSSNNHVPPYHHPNVVEHDGSSKTLQPSAERRVPIQLDALSHTQM